MSAGADGNGADRIRVVRTAPRRRWLTTTVVVVVLVLFLASRVAGFYTDVLWFRSVGFDDVLWRQLGTQFFLGVGSGAIVALLVIGNLLLARRLAPPYRIPTAEEVVVERYRQLLLPYARRMIIGVGVLFGVLVGLTMSGSWQTVLLWLNAVPFDRADPQFGRDVGWFVFSLPMYTLVNSWLSSVLVFVILLTLIGHYVFGGIRPQAPVGRVSPAANVHVSVLLALFVALRAWGFWLNQYLLSYSERGQVTGLSYTDVNAELPAYRLLVIIAAVCVLLFLANIRYRNYLLPAAGVGILLVAAVVLSGIYPAVIQRVQVAPQELDREEPYLQRNLDMTRFAYGLDQVDSSSFAADNALSGDDIAANRTALESVRLWDPATLQATYQQVQAFRPYYEFADVDIDRYEIDGELRQVLLSVRELDEAAIPAQARTWQNQRLVYTHGYGYAASPASAATAQGQPLFVARDIPPAGNDELIVDNPRIYFGERPPLYSIVGTDTDELDYPLESGDTSFERTAYEGEGGVEVGSPLRRLAFALRFGEPNFVLSGLINADSKVLYNREVKERVQRVAPYLKLDHDPYAVAVDGRIKWVLDAYTTSDMVPYSDRNDLGPLTAVDQRVFQTVQGPDGPVIQEAVVPVPGIAGEANYIRNSVKAVVDAYDGTVTLYARDPDDPVLAAWQKAFPSTFVPVEEASAQLQAHFRYPEDLFRVQSSVYTTYHMTNPAEFYAKEDAWAIPRDASVAANLGERATSAQRAKPLRPYYLLLRLPGESEEEFALMQPFIPTGENRRNLIGYLAGRSDPEVYGELRAFTFPSNRTVFGPEQMQSRIDGDEDVSEQITLWSEAGSTVSRGNLLVLPIEDSLLYVQPLFLQADQNSIPEMKRVVVAYGDSIVMADTLAESLAELFGETIDVDPPGEPVAPEVDGGDDGDGQPVEGDASDPRVAALVQRALDRFADAEKALRDGDLAAYQEATNDAEALLRQAQALIDPDAPPPTEEPSAGPTEDQ